AVRGQVERHEPEGQPAAAGPAGLLVDAVRRGIGLLVLGLFLVFLFPGFSRWAGETLVRAPLRSLLVGLGGLLGLPVLAALVGLGATSQPVAEGRREDRPAEQPSTV